LPVHSKRGVRRFSFSIHSLSIELVARSRTPHDFVGQSAEGISAHASELQAYCVAVWRENCCTFRLIEIQRTGPKKGIGRRPILLGRHPQCPNSS
jgi:hypothetical protein